MVQSFYQFTPVFAFKYSKVGNVFAVSDPGRGTLSGMGPVHFRRIITPSVFFTVLLPFVPLTRNNSPFSCLLCNLLPR